MTWIAMSILVMALALTIATVPVIFAMVAETETAHRRQSAQGRWRGRPARNAPGPGSVGPGATCSDGLSDHSDRKWSGCRCGGFGPAGPGRGGSGRVKRLRGQHRNRTRSRPTRRDATRQRQPALADTVGRLSRAFSSPEGDRRSTLLVICWVANDGNSTVVEFTPAQLAATGSATPAVTLSGAAGGSLDDPEGLAFDSAGDLWVTNEGNSTVVEFTRGQLAITGSPTPAVTLSATAGDSLDDPEGLAFSLAGDLWVANHDNNTVVEFTPGQLAATGSLRRRSPCLRRRASAWTNRRA